MKLLVCGGRKYADKEWLFRFLSRTIHQEENAGRLSRAPLVIHGDAWTGADRLADEWAVQHWIQPVRCPALWNELGRRAGILRNITMLELKPDLVVAFPGGRGTAHMVRIAKAAGIRVIESPK